MRAALLLLPVALLAACGSGDEEPAASTTTTTEEATTTTIKTASVEQYASIVAAHRDELLETIERTRDCTLFYEWPCEQTAGLVVFTVGLKAQTLSLELDSADLDRPENQLYIGAVPDELERIVADTIEAANEAQAQAEAFQDEGCGAQPGAEIQPAATCSDTALFTDLAFGDLSTVLLRWGPYL